VTLAEIITPIEKKLNRTYIRLEHGDLTTLEVDAVVFYAREDLQLGAGYGTAISSRGGQAVKKELERIGRIGMGEAVVTAGGALTPGHIIHACGPKFQEPGTEAKLRACMLAALKAAEENGLRTVAFPPMGAGFYGVPLDSCARVMLDAIRTHLQGESAIDEIILCVVDQRDFEAFRKHVEKL
jgi:O-acetyl-ADP-ribose deacetylase (regulator of RNase III)